VIEEVVGSLRLQAQAKGLLLLTAMPDGPLMFRTDRRTLNQIVINLVNNAIKFTERGQVSVSVCELADNGRRILQIDVEDTGVGIRPGSA
jgi:signal transduction histidine kinase